MKEQILKTINDNSVPLQSSEYGEGIFIDTEAVSNISDGLVELFSKQIVISTDPQCKHPIDKLTDWHNNSVLCLECNSIVAEQGQNLKDPIRLNITRY